MKLTQLPKATLDRVRASVPKVPRVTLPAPPSVNNSNVTRGGRRFKSPEYRDWRAAVSGLLLALESPASYPCEFYYALEGVWNLSRDGGANVEKSLLDATVAAGVIPDDSLRYVVGWHGAYLGGTGEPRVTVWFEEVRRE